QPTAPRVTTPPMARVPEPAVVAPIVTAPRPVPAPVAPAPPPSPPAPPREQPVVPNVTRFGPSTAPVVVAPTPPMPPAPERAVNLRLQVLVYDESPAQRMVFIDGRRYVEGDRIDADTVLERITPDGAVVNRRGQRITITDRR